MCKCSSCCTDVADVSCCICYCCNGYMAQCSEIVQMMSTVVRCDHYAPFQKIISFSFTRRLRTPKRNYYCQVRTFTHSKLGLSPCKMDSTCSSGGSGSFLRKRVNVGWKMPRGGGGGRRCCGGGAGRSCCCSPPFITLNNYFFNYASITIRLK